MLNRNTWADIVSNRAQDEKPELSSPMQNIQISERKIKRISTFPDEDQNRKGSHSSQYTQGASDLQRTKISEYQNRKRVIKTQDTQGGFDFQGMDIREIENNQENQDVIDLEDVQIIHANDQESASCTRNIECERAKVTSIEACRDLGESNKPMDEDKPITELQRG